MICPSHGAPTYTTQQTRRGELPCPQYNSKPQSQQVSSRRPTPYTVRSLGSTLSPLQPSNLQCDSEQNCSENELNLSRLLNRSSKTGFQPNFLGKFGYSSYNGRTHMDGPINRNFSLRNLQCIQLLLTSLTSDGSLHRVTKLRPIQARAISQSIDSPTKSRKQIN